MRGAVAERTLDRFPCCVVPPDARYKRHGDISHRTGHGSGEGENKHHREHGPGGQHEWTRIEQGTACLTLIISFFIH